MPRLTQLQPLCFTPAASISCWSVSSSPAPHVGRSLVASYAAATVSFRLCCLLWNNHRVVQRSACLINLQLLYLVSPYWGPHAEPYPESARHPEHVHRRIPIHVAPSAHHQSWASRWGCPCSACSDIPLPDTPRLSKNGNLPRCYTWLRRMPV